MQADTHLPPVREMGICVQSYKYLFPNTYTYNLWFVVKKTVTSEECVVTCHISSLQTCVSRRIRWFHNHIFKILILQENAWNIMYFYLTFAILQMISHDSEHMHYDNTLFPLPYYMQCPMTLDLWFAQNYSSKRICLKYCNNIMDSFQAHHKA